MLGSIKVVSKLFALVLCALVVASSPAQAAGIGGCVRAGEQASNMEHGVVLVGPKLKNGVMHEGLHPWYACSTVRGKRIHLGEFGITSDGEESFHDAVATKNYFAYVTWRQGNAGGGIDLQIRVLDLRNGRKLTALGVGDGPGVPYVDRLLLSADGWIGWTVGATYLDEGATRTYTAYSAFKNQRRLLASNVDRDFLRFAPDRKSLIWSQITGAAYVNAGTSPTISGGRSNHCMKKGERNISHNRAAVLIKKPISTPGWKNGFDLIACLGGVGRRINVGRFGIRTATSEHIAQANTQINSRFLAIAVRTTSPEDSTVRDTIKLFNLVDRVLVGTYTAIYAPEASVSFGVTSMRINSTGSLAWIARRGKPTPAGPIAREVHLVDSNGESLLSTGTTIDPQFLRFGDWTDPAGVYWSEKVGWD
jgi:hypothetical protein